MRDRGLDPRPGGLFTLVRCLDALQTRGEAPISPAGSSTLASDRRQRHSAPAKILMIYTKRATLTKVGR